MVNAQSEFGRSIRRYREKAGLTQAEIPGVGRDHVNKVESGSIKTIPPSVFNRYKKALGFPGFELLADMGYETDVPSYEINPGLIALLGQLSPEQQAVVAELVRATIKGTKS